MPREASVNYCHEIIEDLFKITVSDDYDQHHKRPYIKIIYRAINILTSIAENDLEFEFPQGYASTPGDNTLILEWEHGKRFVHLILQPDRKDDVIVYGSDCKPTVRKAFSEKHLAELLKWVTESKHESVWTQIRKLLRKVFQ